MAGKICSAIQAAKAGPTPMMRLSGGPLSTGFRALAMLVAAGIFRPADSG
jgi:hypothetical protein